MTVAAGTTLIFLIVPAVLGALASIASRRIRRMIQAQTKNKE